MTGAGTAPGSGFVRLSKTGHSPATILSTSSHLSTKTTSPYLVGKMEFGNFVVPVPKFVTTISGAQNKIMFPVAPVLGNNLMSGGLNVGPMFSSAIGQTGILSWSPMLQFGGKLGTATNNGLNGATASAIGLAGNITYTDARQILQMGYGSVSNLLVASYKARIRKGLRLQTGINRYLDDGIYGPRRARLDAEVVDVHPIVNIPFIQSLTFRSSAGWVKQPPTVEPVGQLPRSLRQRQH